MFAQPSLEAEDLSVRRGELLFGLVDLVPSGAAFAAERCVRVWITVLSAFAAGSVAALLLGLC